MIYERGRRQAPPAQTISTWLAVHYPDHPKISRGLPA